MLGLIALLSSSDSFARAIAIVFPCVINWCILRFYVCISIEGPIAIGKTRLVGVLSEYLNKQGLTVCVIREPVDEWNRELEAFGRDMKRYGFMFQIVALTSRIRKIKECVRTGPFIVDVYIMERSPLSDTIFMKNLHRSGNMEPMEYEAYWGFWHMWVPISPIVPTYILYLRSSASICMERLRIRNRPGEQDVTKGYQQELIDMHDEMFGLGSDKRKESTYLKGTRFVSSSMDATAFGLLRRVPTLSIDGGVMDIDYLAGDDRMEDDLSNCIWSHIGGTPLVA